MPTKTTPTEPVMNKSIVNTILVVALIVASGAIGHLWTKTQYLEGGASAGKAIAPSVAGQAAAPPTASAKDLDPVTDEDHIRGNRDAKIVLVEYSDLECPYCKQFHSTAQQVVDEYDGQVAWVYRHWPLDQIHSKARKEAEAVECAAAQKGDEGFWALTDLIFTTTQGNNTLNLDTLPDLAAQAGLNRGEFTTCLDSGKMADLVEANYQSGIKAGVTGTPGNILLNTETGETQLIPGAVPFTQVQQLIDIMLEA